MKSTNKTCKEIYKVWKKFCQLTVSLKIAGNASLIEIRVKMVSV